MFGRAKFYFVLAHGFSPIIGKVETHSAVRHYPLEQYVMAISKEKKQVALGRLADARKGAETIVFAKFTGLKGQSVTAMRKELRERGVGYIVAKKTLMERVLNEGGYTGTLPELPGEIAFVYSADAIAPAQSIGEFEKKFKGAIAIVGGVFAGAYKDKAEMSEIATIPSLPVLRGMFAQLINSPRQRFAVVLSKVSETKN